MPSELLRPVIRGQQLKGQKSPWKTQVDQSVSRMNFSPVGLVLYAPLWFQGFSGSSFKAWDVANGSTRSCAVTGAVWTPQGRGFVAASSQYISTGNWTKTTAMDISILVWFKADSVAGNQSLWVAAPSNASPPYFASWLVGSKLRYNYAKDAANYVYWQTDTTTLSAGTWYLASIIQVGDAIPTMYINNISQSVSVAGGAGTPTNPGTQPSAIGRYGASGTQYFGGLVGETLIYNRALTAAEIQNIYLATKWRYS
uniref:Putative structural protein n=1 Tax=viral metagenome TaxID=1070528 RepID=A0A6M3KL95_9ZZZZ